jgi:serine/threonine-protein phosphatase PGAM5
MLLTLAALTSLSASEAEAAEQPPAPQGIRFVTLIRHAIYDRVDSLDDRVANGLNVLGREQANILGKRLAKLPVKPRLLATSDLKRARETADVIGALLSVKTVEDSLLAECTPPSSRPGLDEKQDPKEMASCLANLESAWAKYFRPSPDENAHDLLVCHGNVIRWFVNRALANDVRHWTSLDIANASITVIAVRPDGTTRLIVFSDVGHLPVEKQTWAGSGPGWGKPAR